MLWRRRRSWGPLGILVTTEIQPLETRSASQSLSVVNFTFWQFVITQTYLSMLCRLRWGVFMFFGGRLQAVRAKISSLKLPCAYPATESATLTSTHEAASLCTPTPTSECSNLMLPGMLSEADCPSATVVL